LHAFGYPHDFRYFGYFVASLGFRIVRQLPFAREPWEGQLYLCSLGVAFLLEVRKTRSVHSEMCRTTMYVDAKSN
jgi:hypothetical protein